MKAVMYGAGNIGRGFIGMTLAQSGYEVTFIDVAKPVVEALRKNRSYPVRLLSDSGSRDVLVQNCTAVDGNDAEAASEAIASCDLMATAVGARILPYLVPNIVAGLRKRWARGGGILNLIICENLNDAAEIFAGMIKEKLTGEEKTIFDEKVGMVEASIGRMVPVQTDEMKDGDPLRVCVEEYGFLPVDKAAFKGEIPPIQNLVPYEPFDFFLKRKLFLHNMGHAVCAYLGGYAGQELICRSIDDPEIRILTQNAMLESALALAKRYDADLSGLMLHVTDLLHRFANAALGDTCARVGQDVPRKMSPSDRLIGSSRLCLEEGVAPLYITLGAAAGIFRHLKETGAEKTRENAAAFLREVSGLEETDPLAVWILSYFDRLLAGASLSDLRREADRNKSQSLGNVI